MKLRLVMVLAAAALAMTACKEESASLLLDGPHHALTLDIHQPWPWSHEFELEAIMARLPDCQRRSRLDNAALGDIRVDVFRPPAETYAEPILIVRQGANSYAVSEKSCELQRFKEPPKDPGVKLGTFSIEGGALKFTPAPAPPTAPAVTPGVAPAPVSVPANPS